MEMFEACEAFSSILQETRLKVFRLLIQYGRDGAVPRKLAEELKIPDNTLLISPFAYEQSWIGDI